MAVSLSFIIGIIGNVISFLVFTSPIKTFWGVLKKKSTENYQGLPYITTLLSTSLWTFYGILNPNGLLIMTVNGAGAILQLIYVIIFLIYAPMDKKVKTGKLFAILDVGFFGSVIVLTLFAIREEIKLTFVGLLCAALTIGMYASPLTVMGLVIRMKSVEYMPFFLSFFLFLNAGIWSIYSMLVKDFFIGVPNAIGFILGCAQLILYSVYRNKSKKPLEVLEEEGSVTLKERAVEMQEHGGDGEEVDLKNKSLNKGLSLPKPLIKRLYSMPTKIMKTISLNSYELDSAWALGLGEDIEAAEKKSSLTTVEPSTLNPSLHPPNQVPAESLARLKWVSKSWHGLITDPSFAFQHHHKNDGLSSTSILLSWVSSDLTGDEEMKPLRSAFRIPEAVYPTDFFNLFHCMSDFFDHLPHTYLWDEMYDFYRTYHCNGIICIAQYFMDKGQSVLINPVIRETRILPATSINDRGIVRTHGEGFGYDLQANDFKLVRIFGHRFTCSAELYSMNSDSWKEIVIDEELEEAPFCRGRGVLCKGVFYWLMLLNTGYETILTFDMSTEEFHTRPPPVGPIQGAANDNDEEFLIVEYEKCLVEWNQSVALLMVKVEEFEVNLPCTIEMWVLDDNNDGEYSWTQHPTIGNFETYYSPLIFWNTDELLMVNYRHGVVSYNLNYQTFRSLLIPRLNVSTCISNYYVQSLISVKRRDD
ncbi:hypothetical protein F8388_018471 [Cannabis sativa]|uniref:F-box associated beta-propeller type 1 domain-containing protein n=1 Tax=Cannabis sativa TaxID=3483 RepID=A0A7J6F2B7_CANSA|nr:hypothetical protein F8388_018471 [Cannabis sativa]